MAYSAGAARFEFGGRCKLDGKLMEQGASRLLHAEATQLKMTYFRIGLKFHEYRKKNRSFVRLWLQRTICSDVCTL